MTLWAPIDTATAAVATLQGDTTDHTRVREAATELDTAARQTVAAALRARKLVRTLPHPDWPVARLAARNAPPVDSTFALLDGEIHHSTIPAAVSRGLRWLYR